MKYQGEDVKKVSKATILIQRNGQPDMRITITALPLGFEEGSERELPSPTPTVTGFAKDAKGKPLRDPMTDKPILVTNEESAEFKLEVTNVNRLQSIRMIYEALKEDSGLTFDSKRVDFKSAADFFTAIFTELVVAGFTSGDYIKLIKAILDVSGLTQADVQGAVDDFLSTVEK